MPRDYKQYGKSPEDIQPVDTARVKMYFKYFYPFAIYITAAK